MGKILMIPVLKEMEKSLELAKEYGAGFEFNDFFAPEVLDSEELLDGIVAEYQKYPLPELRTVHGAFYDVTVFSPDKRIREISDLRVRQSIAAAKKIGASAIVFHTNHNPFLNTQKYMDEWLDTNEKYWSKILGENPDINIYLENMFDIVPKTLKELSERLCRYKNYGVCLDSAHSALTFVPHQEWAEELGKYVKHVHINDNDLTSDGHLALGDGKIDWDEFYQIYERNLNNASVLVEMPDLERQEKSLKRLRSDGFLS